MQRMKIGEHRRVIDIWFMKESWVVVKNMGDHIFLLRSKNITIRSKNSTKFFGFHANEYLLAFLFEVCFSIKFDQLF